MKVLLNGHKVPSTVYLNIVLSCPAIKFSIDLIVQMARAVGKAFTRRHSIKATDLHNAHMSDRPYGHYDQTKPLTLIFSPGCIPHRPQGIDPTPKIRRGLKTYAELATILRRFWSRRSHAGTPQNVKSHTEYLWRIPYKISKMQPGIFGEDTPLFQNVVLFNWNKASEERGMLSRNVVHTNLTETLKPHKLTYRSTVCLNVKKSTYFEWKNTA